MRSYNIREAQRREDKNISYKRSNDNIKRENNTQIRGETTRDETRGEDRIDMEEGEGEDNNKKINRNSRTQRT